MRIPYFYLKVFEPCIALPGPHITLLGAGVLSAEKQSGNEGEEGSQTVSLCVWGRGRVVVSGGPGRPVFSTLLCHKHFLHRPLNVRYRPGQSFPGVSSNELSALSSSKKLTRSSGQYELQEWLASRWRDRWMDVCTSSGPFRYLKPDTN